MKPKIWYMWDPGPAVREKLEPVADLVIGGSLETLPGVDAVVINNIIDASATFFDQADRKSVV